MKTYYCLLFCFSLTSLYGQTTISGRVLDTGEHSLAYANVLLLQPQDSSLVVGTVTEADGSYRLAGVARGDYLLSATMIGYRSTYRPVVIGGDQPTVTQPAFVLADDTETLEEVVVKARRPLFEHRIDRLVVNVGESITATGGNALEVLQKSPGVRVDGINNQLSLEGNAGVLVQVNGKRTRLDGDALLQFLRSLPAANLDRIELISTPPASYDAEGVGGIINIVMNKPPDEGLNGNVSLNAGYGQRPKFGGAADLNFRRGRVNLYTSLSSSNEYLQEDITITKQIRNEEELLATDTYSNRPAFRAFHRASIGLDYELGEETTLGVTLAGHLSRWQLDAATATEVRSNGEVREVSELRSLERNDWQHWMGNFSFRHVFPKKLRLAVDYDYLNYHNDNPTDYTDRLTDGAGNLLAARDFLSRKENPIGFHVAKVDLSQPLREGWNVEYGAKLSVSDLANDNLLADLENGTRIPDPRFTDLVDMDERIYAGYLSTDYQLSEKTSVKAGIRYEYTDIALANATSVLTARAYGRFFPSAFLSHTFDEHNSLQLSYSERIQRPNLNVLAPAFFFFSPNVVTTGNPAIREAINRNLHLSLRHRSVMLNLTTGWENNPFFWGQLEVTPEENLTVTRPENMRDARFVTAFFNFPLRLADWWESRYETGMMWQEQYPRFEGTAIRQRSVVYGFRTQQTFTLSESMALEVDGFWQSRMGFGLAENPAKGTFNVGLQKRFANESRLSLTCQDVFNLGSFYASDFDRPALNLVYRQVYQHEGSVFRLTYSRSFGNNKLKTRQDRNGASADERNRVQ